MTISAKTSDRLLGMASELQAIGDELYVHCLNDMASIVIRGAEQVASAAAHLQSYVENNGPITEKGEFMP